MPKKKIHYVMIVSLFLLSFMLLFYGFTNLFVTNKYLDVCNNTENKSGVFIKDEGFILGPILGCDNIRSVLDLLYFSIVVGFILFAIGLYEQYRYEIYLH